YWHQYKENKKKCGRKVIQLPAHEVDYIKEKVTLGWTPDVIIGCVMPLVPGVQITNAIRDLLAGHYVSGVSRGTEAMMTAT
ncbi:threonine/serine exporter family protein, partial [Enterococcus faecium]|uniref:threonine/serine exporter family protein n=1 Tax=Enterococcus faecium TaxID=1352 RepID=UPI0039778C76